MIFKKLLFLLIFLHLPFLFLGCKPDTKQAMTQNNNIEQVVTLSETTMQERSQQSTPEVDTLTWKQITTGSSHSCGLTTEDKAFCWGESVNGRLGTAPGDLTNKELPTAVSVASVSTWKILSAGSFHTCGISTDDKAYCWGEGFNGQLGIAVGNTENIDIPTTVSTDSVSTWKVISAGASHTCGLSMDDKAYCWGRGYSNQLGIGADDSSDKHVPMAVSTETVSAWKTISAGVNHSCGITMDDKAYCWGDGFNGQLGIEVWDTRNIGKRKDIPTAVSTELNWKEISAGNAYTCGIDVSDKAYCWGYGASGRLGIAVEDKANKEVPTMVSAELVSAWKMISTGNEHSCGIAADDKAYCWGEGINGRLGTATGDITSREIPVRVSVEIVNEWTTISIGDYHSCGLSMDNKAYCWGDGFNGQLGKGVGSVAPSHTPTAVR